MSAVKRTGGKAAEAKARRAFWVLIAIAVIAMGSLTSALARQPGALTGLTVAASGVVLLLASALACRVMVALEQRRRGESAGEVNFSAGRARPGAGIVTVTARDHRRRKDCRGEGKGERAAGGRRERTSSRRSSAAGRG